MSKQSNSKSPEVTKSKEVIRQFPSEELLVLARSLNSQLDSGDKIKAINLFSSTA